MMEFAWHEPKRAGNVRKHGVDFVDVFEAFGDRRRLVMEDHRFDYGEIRLNMLARIGGRVFHITYTERGDVVWLISARRANARERARYAEG